MLAKPECKVQRCIHDGSKLDGINDFCAPSGEVRILNSPGEANQCGSWLMVAQVEFDEMGSVRGVTSEGETAKAKKVVCDPSYLPNKVRE